jgi:SAM-dependent methyltransferase
MPGGDEIRDVQRAAWAGLSAGWEKWDAVIMDQLGPVGTAMIERLGIAADQRHLDIAAGTGEPGLTVARLAPGGHVVLTDLAAEMLGIAARRANAQGITNFETRVCSADDLPFGDAAFDSISVRFGYMFFPDVARATAEFARVLRPGGRLCSSVWAGPGENPWTTIVMQAIAAEAVLPPPDPDRPGMFRCAAPGYVSALYEAAGLRGVAERDVAVELVTDSPAQYWEMISEHVSLAVAALAQVGGPARSGSRKLSSPGPAPTNKTARSGFRDWPAASPARSRDARTEAPAHSCQAAELILAAGNSRQGPESVGSRSCLTLSDRARTARARTLPPFCSAA